MVFAVRPGIILLSDAEGYYQYLPQLFYHNNIMNMPYAVTLPNGLSFNKYTCGTAMLQSPFFYLAHIYCKIFGNTAFGNNSSSNVMLGFSSTYANFIWIGAVTYTYIALVLLYHILRKWFYRITSFVAVFVVYFGTNLLYYTICLPGYSHVYSFFILVLFVYRLDKFITKRNFINALFCGIPLGIGILIRPTNIFYVLLFLLYDVYTFAAIWSRIKWIFGNLKYFLVILFSVFVVFIPQMLYWHAIVGKYFVYAYEYSAQGAEKFIYWDQPKIGEVLFGVENGWLIYSPVFFLFIIGLIYSLIKGSGQSLAILILFLLITYANASWWTYSFMCSFGHRAYIEYYPLFVIPIAYLFQQTLVFKRKFALITVSFLLLALAYTSFRWAQFFYVEQCWLKSDGWNWEKYNKAWNKAFYIIPQSRNLK
jgi:hypothetical protein